VRAWPVSRRHPARARPLLLNSVLSPHVKSCAMARISCTSVSWPLAASWPLNLSWSRNSHLAVRPYPALAAEPWSRSTVALHLPVCTAPDRRVPRA